MPGPRYLWLALLLSAHIARADETSPRSPDSEPGHTQLQLANGSSVRLTVLHDRVEVVTRYGALQVPLRDVQKIEFGVRLPPGVARRVEAAIAKLGSNQYGEREAGARELTALGAHGYPALKRALKHTDKEVSRRAATIIAALRQKVPEKELRDREEDVITTPGFTVVGRIVPAALKVSSEYFGEVQLPLGQLRQLRALTASVDLTVTVDAAKWGSAHGQWMDTGFECQENVDLAIKATGLVDLFPQTPGQYMSTPGGMQAAGGGIMRVGGVVMNQRNLQQMAGTLLGRVGDSGTPFVVGDSYEGSPGEGKLYLHIVPSPWNNASTGSYQVKISPKQ